MRIQWKSDEDRANVWNGYRLAIRQRDAGQRERFNNAGWHHARTLMWPGNVTPMYLPPYSPELNPAENVWQFLRSHQLSNQIFETHASLLRRVDWAWTQLDTPRLRSLCRAPWIVGAIQA